jgi:beta-galactosidase
MVAAAGVNTPTLPVPAGVEVCRRVGQGREVFVLLNHAKQAVEIALPQAMGDVLNGGETRQIESPPYGVAVLSRASPASAPASSP